MIDNIAQLERENLSAIQKFIIKNVEANNQTIVKVTSSHFGISRQAVHKQIQELIEKGIVEATGKTRARNYSLKTIVSYHNVISLNPSPEEDLIWKENIAPLFEGIDAGVRTICNYGFTEILNNAIDHSSSQKCEVLVFINANEINIKIKDFGIGIFKKIKDALRLEDEHQAILELSKGKFTTDPTRHSGEGIFFTSRIFDNFIICSKGISFVSRDNEDWLIDGELEKTSPDGTFVIMTIGVHSEKKLNDIFKKYTTEEDGHFGFTKTHIAIKLALYKNDGLISRSQAKRILARTEKFKEVILDFTDVDSIGQAFSDEIFRVFKNQNPEISLIPVSMNEEVESMVKRAKTHQ